jgi:uncharacterized protein
MCSPKIVLSLLVGISLVFGACGGRGKKVAGETDDVVCLKRADLRLVVATLNRNTGGVETSLRDGADANTSIEGFGPPIVLAALTDNIDAVKLLLDKGANVNAGDREGYTALITASLNNNEEIVHLLLARGADVNAAAHPARNDQKIRLTALMIAKSRHYDNIVKLLTEAGAKE